MTALNMMCAVRMCRFKAVVEERARQKGVIAQCVHACRFCAWPLQVPTPGAQLCLRIEYVSLQFSKLHLVSCIGAQVHSYLVTSSRTRMVDQWKGVTADRVTMLCSCRSSYDALQLHASLATSKHHGRHALKFMHQPISSMG